MNEFVAVGNTVNDLMKSCKLIGSINAGKIVYPLVVKIFSGSFPAISSISAFISTASFMPK